MRELGGYLVDIHGQSEHLSLLNVRQHIHLLDRYRRRAARTGSVQGRLHAPAGPAPRAAKAAPGRAGRRTAHRSAGLPAFKRSTRRSSSRARTADCARSATAWPTPRTWLPSAQQALALLDEGAPETPAADRSGRAGGPVDGQHQPHRCQRRTLAEQAATIVRSGRRSGAANCAITWKGSSSTPAAWSRRRNAWT